MESTQIQRQKLFTYLNQIDFHACIKRRNTNVIKQSTRVSEIISCRLSALAFLHINDDGFFTQTVDKLFLCV